MLLLLKYEHWRTVMRFYVMQRASNSALECNKGAAGLCVYSWDPLRFIVWSCTSNKRAALNWDWNWKEVRMRRVTVNRNIHIDSRRTRTRTECAGERERNLFDGDGQQLNLAFGEVEPLGGLVARARHLLDEVELGLELLALPGARLLRLVRARQLHAHRLRVQRHRRAAARRARRRRRRRRGRHAARRRRGHRRRAGAGAHRRRRRRSGSRRGRAAPAGRRRVRLRALLLRAGDTTRLRYHYYIPLPGELSFVLH